LSESEHTYLWYMGIPFPEYRIYRNGCLIRYQTFRSGPNKGRRIGRRVTIHMNRDGYLCWKVKKRGMGGQRRLSVHRAVADSFDYPGGDTSHLVAAHRPGTAKSDIAYGSVELVPQKVNCEHKWRDGTYSTGHDTKPNKLKGREPRVLELWDRYQSYSAVAELMDVNRNSIRRLVKKFRRV